ncbi:unnamed protein product [Lathyrus oleraceus]
MRKGIRNLNSWMEVAPPAIIFPTKPSNSPTLETIKETAEEYDDIQKVHK